MMYGTFSRFLVFNIAPSHIAIFSPEKKKGLWTGEVDHSKLGPGKVHEIIGLPAAMMAFVVELYPSDFYH